MIVSAVISSDSGTAVRLRPAPGGAWLAAKLLADPNPEQLQQAAAHAYAAAQRGPFGLALDDEGALVLCSWIDDSSAADIHRLGPRLGELATAWRRALGADLQSRSQPGTSTGTSTGTPAGPTRLEDRIRHGLLRAF